MNRITYVNQTTAVTAVSRDTFVNARPVARNVVAVQAREIEQAPVSHMTGVEPVRGSVMGTGKPTTVAPPRAVVNRQVVAQHAPVQPPVPFAQRQDKLLVRPVAPVTQPANARPEPMNRPEQPINRTQPAINRPEPAMNKLEPASVERPVQQAPRPGAEPQPQMQPQPRPEPARPEAPRPEAARPEPPRPQPQAVRAPQPYNNEVRPPQEWSHPQAKPAPPVQPKSETQARDEETKYRNWQQQAKPQPPPKPQPPAKPQPEKPAPPKDKDKKPPQR